MVLFNPKTPLLTTIAETFTSDLKAGFTRSTNKIAGTSMAFDSLEKMPLLKSISICGLEFWVIKPFPEDVGVKFFLLFSYFQMELDTSSEVRMRCLYRNSCELRGYGDLG